jgi:3',5'-cyclic AMP phosphodiesterase CpdA
MSMRIALIGDIHLYRLDIPPYALLGKRLLGQANVWFKRRHRFDASLLPHVLGRAATIDADLRLFTGDITTTAWGGEFDDAAKLIRADASTVMIPGNHDRYTFAATRRRMFEQVFGDMAPPLPHLRQLSDRWHLLAIDTAVPRIITSRGRCGAAQLAEAGRLVESLPDDGGVIVMGHYPAAVWPQHGASHWQHRLADIDQLDALLHRIPGRVVYVHGHIHVPWVWRRSERLLDINAGAPCMVGSRFKHGQGFWQIDLPSDPAQPLKMARHVIESRDKDPGSPPQWGTVAISQPAD